MLDRDKLKAVAGDFKRDAGRRFDAALSALLDLAWDYGGQGDDFSFESDPVLYAEALRICREMSDGCMEDARSRFAKVVEGLEFYDGETAWDAALEDDTLARFDMAGSHLLQLLSLWVSVAITNKFTKDYTRISIMRYLRNPLASGLFGKVGKDMLRWGRGFDRNIIDRLAVIGQNLIIDASRHAEWQDAAARGASYYIRRRGSSYICPDCDSLCGYPIPIETPFLFIHSRCMCWPEYHFGPMGDE